MSSELASPLLNRKRNLDDEQSTTGLTAPAKRRKFDRQQPVNFPPSFWDNLSRLWLTVRALREFDRRTDWPAPCLQPDFTGAQQVDPVQIKLFAAEGGPRLEDLRSVSLMHRYEGSLLMIQFPKPKKSTVESQALARSDMTSASGSKTTAYSHNFEQHMIDSGCYPPLHPDPAHEEHPRNRNELIARLQSPRPSSQAFTQKNFTDFLTANKSCVSEMDVTIKVLPTFAGNSTIPYSTNIMFTNLEPLTHESVTPKVDWYDGTSPNDIAKSVRDYLDEYIVPGSHKENICLPNFLTEVKGPDGSINVLRRQALLAGCLGGRGVQELLGWAEPQSLDNKKAYTITCTYEPVQCNLIFYAIHPTRTNNVAHRPLSSPLKRYYTYRMTKLKSYLLAEDLDTFTKGIWAFRNAREWAKAKRDELVVAANVMAPSLANELR
ncbi:MAG: hypothetical protein Q9213_003801 [Squamulea squamosa]